MKRLLGLILVLGAFVAGSSALADEKEDFVRRQIGMVQRLAGEKGNGGGTPGALGQDGAPVASQVTAEALALIAAKQLRQGEPGVAPLTSEEVLLAVDDLLRKLDADDPSRTAADIFTIEQLGNDSLKKLIQAGRDPNAPEWLQRLARLARMEAAARGLDVQNILNEPLGEAQRPGGQQGGQQSGGQGGNRNGRDGPHAAPMGDHLGGTSSPMDVTSSDLEVLARIVKGEIPESAPREGHVAVAAVVLNRVRNGGFGKTVAEVAHAPWQFSCYNADQRDRLYWGNIPEYAWAAARAALGGENPVPGCCFYFNPYLVSPSWASSMTLYRRIGTSATTTHDFYRANGGR